MSTTAPSPASGADDPVREPEGPRLPAPSAGSFVAGLVRDWGIAILVVVVVVLGYGALSRPSPPALGPAPAFVLTDLDGAKVALPDVPGDVVILNFWFTTCPPCRAEIPELSKFHDSHPDVPMYGVSTDVGMPTGRLKAQSERLGITYPVLHDARAEVAALYGVSSFPTTLIIRGGNVVGARVGAVDGTTLAQMVEAASP